MSSLRIGSFALSLSMSSLVLTTMYIQTCSRVSIHKVTCRLILSVSIKMEIKVEIKIKMKQLKMM